jgi:hypothetical protein
VDQSIQFGENYGLLAKGKSEQNKQILHQILIASPFLGKNKLWALGPDDFGGEEGSGNYLTQLSLVS